VPPLKLPMLLRNVARQVSRLAASGRELGLYAALILLVPGGSLVALGMWALRQRNPAPTKGLRS
jgi:hypothetical protein